MNSVYYGNTVLFFEIETYHGMLLQIIGRRKGSLYLVWRSIWWRAELGWGSVGVWK